jgi:hypothetical protein
MLINAFVLHATKIQLYFKFLQTGTLYILLLYIYIYDQLLIAQDYEDLEYMTRKLIDEYKLWGLN